MEPVVDENLYHSNKGLENVVYAGFWVRLGAIVLDGLILAPLTLVGMYNSLDIKSPIIMAIVALCAFCYKPYMEWQFSDTYGKRLMKIKLVDAKGNNISQEQAFNRYAPWVVSFIISMGINISLYVSDEFYNADSLIELGELAQRMPLNTVSSIYNFIFLVIVGSAGVDILKQGYHDKFAKTFCIYKETPKTK